MYLTSGSPVKCADLSIWAATWTFYFSVPQFLDNHCVGEAHDEQRCEIKEADVNDEVGGATRHVPQTFPLRCFVKISRPSFLAKNFCLVLPVKLKFIRLNLYHDAEIF